MESTSELQKTCLQLALEGERFCGQGDCKRGVQLFETALQVGTSDLDTLSAIYTELGNAYFVLHQYREALKYYNYDLNLARMMRDRANEGKAYSNLSIALKALNLFEEAFACCQHQLKIYKETADLAGEAKAYYNTGNVHYAVAKQSLVNEIEVQGRTHNSLLQAIHNYKLSIEASRQVKEDSSLLGRCYGNVGNALYLLGEFKEAILYHKKRLKLACLHGDLEAQKRAHTNLGNCCIFSRRFQTAITHYEACLSLSQQIGDKAMEAQAHYNLGNAYSLIGKLKVSLKYHQEHLVLAKLLKDKMGEMRAWWSLSDVYSRMEDPDNAQQCYNCYYQLSSSQSADVISVSSKSPTSEEQFDRPFQQTRTLQQQHQTSQQQQHQTSQQRQQQKLPSKQLSPQKHQQQPHRTKQQQTNNNNLDNSTIQSDDDDYDDDSDDNGDDDDVEDDGSGDDYDDISQIDFIPILLKNIQACKRNDLPQHKTVSCNNNNNDLTNNAKNNSDSNRNKTDKKTSNSIKNSNYVDDNNNNNIDVMNNNNIDNNIDDNINIDDDNCHDIANNSSNSKAKNTTIKPKIINNIGHSSNNSSSNNNNKGADVNEEMSSLNTLQLQLPLRSSTTTTTTAAAATTTATTTICNMNGNIVATSIATSYETNSVTIRNNNDDNNNNNNNYNNNNIITSTPTDTSAITQRRKFKKPSKKIQVNNADVNVTEKNDNNENNNNNNNNTDNNDYVDGDNNVFSPAADGSVLKASKKLKRLQQKMHSRLEATSSADTSSSQQRPTARPRSASRNQSAMTSRHHVTGVNLATVEVDDGEEEEEEGGDDDLCEILTRCQSRRLNDQRSSYLGMEKGYTSHSISSKSSSSSVSTTASVGLTQQQQQQPPKPQQQQQQPNKQQPQKFIRRPSIRLPGFLGDVFHKKKNNNSINNNSSNNNSNDKNNNNNKSSIDSDRLMTESLNDIMNILMKVQGNRMENQRSVEPSPVHQHNCTFSSLSSCGNSGVLEPDEADALFGLIQNLQSHRLDEQRVNPPSELRTTTPSSETDSCSIPAKKTPKKNVFSRKRL